MKKTLKKLMCIALSVIMAAGVFVISANADDKTIENLYDVNKAGVGTSPNTINASASGNANYYSSHAIEVSEGDVLTFGPVLKDQGWFLKGYNSEGNVTVSDLSPSAATQTGVILGNAVILQWTVPKGVAYIRMTTSQMFFDSTVITKNQPFGKDEYYACMDKQGVNIDYLRPVDCKETLVNKFPVSEKTYNGRIDASSGQVESESYRSSEFIPVKAGDVIYFAAASSTQGYHLSLRNSSNKGTTNVNKNYMVEYEDLGRGYSIYAYRMRPGTAYATVVISTGVYEDGIALATINQPFTGDTYRKMFNINIEEDSKPKDSPLNGLKGLFMGDSISYGLGDTISYADPYETRAWAGRIGAATGLIPTNASVSGAKASYISGDSADKWLFNQHLDYVNEHFDVIVMHGGVNDARYDRTIGTPNPVDSTEALLKSKTTTYIGGLQWLFHNIKAKFPDATYFFIANHRLDGNDKGHAKDMSAYFNAAEELCAMYGIHFIDLYNNKELNDTLQTETTKYLPDTLHLNSAGYDILTPYIIEEMEAVFNQNTDTPDNTTNSQPDDTTRTPEVDETTVPEASDTTTAATTESGCGSIAVSPILAILSVISLAGAVIFKKK